jgi:hypothetical protein
MKNMAERSSESGRRRQQTGIRMEEWADLLPPGWPQDVPLARITTCGCAPLVIEVLCGFEKLESSQGPISTQISF